MSPEDGRSRPGEEAAPEDPTADHAQHSGDDPLQQVADNLNAALSGAKPTATKHAAARSTDTTITVCSVDGQVGVMPIREYRVEEDKRSVKVMVIAPRQKKWRYFSAPADYAYATIKTNTDVVYDTRWVTDPSAGPTRDTTETVFVPEEPTGGVALAPAEPSVPAVTDEMTSEDARALTDEIKADAEALWDKLAVAYTERAWAALGYESWDDYCAQEFAGTRLRLPREERREVVCSLRESGLSIRAIAAATGVSKNTVQADVSQIGTPETEPIDAEIVEAPGSLTDQSPGQTDRVTAALERARGQKPITGTDGKTYSPNKPKPVADPEPTFAELADVVDLSVKVRAASRKLKDVLSKVQSMRGRWVHKGSGEDFSAVITEAVASMRLYLDAIEQAAGTDLDSDLARLLDPDGEAS